MLHPWTFRGARGLVRCGYTVAAIVAPFVVTVDRTTKQGTLTGTVAQPNAFLLTQRPLEFIVPALPAACWPVETITVTADQVVAGLGPLAAPAPSHGGAARP